MASNFVCGQSVVNKGLNAILLQFYCPQNLTLMLWKDKSVARPRFVLINRQSPQEGHYLDM